MTEAEKVELAILATEVRAGFDNVNLRLDTLDKRTEWLDKDGDELRHENMTLRAEIERRPCETNKEEIRRLREKVSSELKMVQTGENTGKIEIAKFEAANKAREEMVERFEAAAAKAAGAAEKATADATAAAERAAIAGDRKWKRIASLLAVLITAIGSASGYQIAKSDNTSTAVIRVVEKESREIKTAVVKSRVMDAGMRQ